MLGTDSRITVLDDNEIEITRQCESCGGTGIYVGSSEGDGAGIVCHKCDGTGREVIKIRATPFTSKARCVNIKRVYAINPGITISEGLGNHFKLSDFGGKSHIDWLIDPVFLPGTECRIFTCPYRWYQLTNSDLKPDWDECYKSKSPSRCKNFGIKEKCWQRWDKQFGSS